MPGNPCDTTDGPERLTPEQRRVYDNVLASPRGVVIGRAVSGCSARSWPTAPRRSASSAASTAALSPICLNFAIVAMGALGRPASNGFITRGSRSKRASILRRWKRSEPGSKTRCPDEKESVVYRFTRELVTKHRVSKPTYDKAIELFAGRCRCRRSDRHPRLLHADLHVDRRLRNSDRRQRQRSVCWNIVSQRSRSRSARVTPKYSKHKIWETLS